MSGKIRTAWFVEILEKLGRSNKKGGMDMGDDRAHKSYKANSERKRRAANKVRKEDLE